MRTRVQYSVRPKLINIQSLSEIVIYPWNTRPKMQWVCNKLWWWLGYRGAAALCFCSHYSVSVNWGYATDWLLLPARSLRLSHTTASLNSFVPPMHVAPVGAVGAGECSDQTTCTACIASLLDCAWCPAMVSWRSKGPCDHFSSGRGCAAIVHRLISACVVSLRTCDAPVSRAELRRCEMSAFRHGQRLPYGGW